MSSPVSTLDWKILSEALLGGLPAGVLDGADDGPGVLPRPGPGNGGGEPGVGLVHRGVGGGDPVQDVERRLGRQRVGGNAFAEGGAAGVAVSAQRDRAVADDGAELAVRSAGGMGRVGTTDRPAVKAVLTTHSGRRGRVHLQALQGAVAAGLVGGAVLPAVPDHVEPGSGQEADGVRVVVAPADGVAVEPVSYTHLRARDTVLDLVC